MTGTGYAPSGEFRRGRPRRSPAATTHLALALRIGALCSDATLDRVDGRVAVLGRPDGGGPARRRRQGRDGARPTLKRDHPRIGEVPFSSEAKRMATVHRTPEGKTVAYVKGARRVVPGGESAPFHRSRASDR